MRSQRWLDYVQHRGRWSYSSALSLDVPDAAPTDPYTLSLHHAPPISPLLPPLHPSSLPSSLPPLILPSSHPSLIPPLIPLSRSGRGALEAVGADRRAELHQEDWRLQG